MRLRTLLLSAVLVCVCGLSVGAVAYTAYEQITVSGIPTALTSSKINAGSGHPQAYSALCRSETSQFRWTTDPASAVNMFVASTSVGALLQVGETLALVGNDQLNNLRLIITGNAVGQLDCHYFSQQ